MKFSRKSGFRLGVKSPSCDESNKNTIGAYPYRSIASWISPLLVAIICMQPTGRLVAIEADNKWSPSTSAWKDTTESAEGPSPPILKSCLRFLSCETCAGGDAGNTQRAASYTNGPNMPSSVDLFGGSWTATARALVPSAAASSLSLGPAAAVAASNDDSPSPTTTASAAAAVAATEVEPVKSRSIVPPRITFPIRFATTAGTSHSADQLSIDIRSKPHLASPLPENFPVSPTTASTRASFRIREVMAPLVLDAKPETTPEAAESVEGDRRTEGPGNGAAGPSRFSDIVQELWTDVHFSPAAMNEIPTILLAI